MHLAPDILSTVETETLLSDIRGRLILHARNDTNPDASDEMFGWTERLLNAIELDSGSANSGSANALAETIFSLRQGPDRDSGLLIRKSLDILTEVEALIVTTNSATEPFELDVADFIETSFEDLIPRNVELSPPAEVDSGEMEGFEIDAELLEIFSEEADELLKGIEECLGRLSANAEDTDALWEIRRHAHTFKGASGVVGLNAASKIAHRIEDLLDRFAEKEAGSGSPILELLKTAATCLRSMTTVDGEHPANQHLEALHRSFDAALSRIDKHRGEPQPTHSETTAAELPESPSKNESEESSIGGDRKRAIIRVPLEKLNALETALHDLVVASSAMERRIADLDHQIIELNNTTQRLQVTSGKIESGLEAEMLGGRAFDSAALTRTGEEEFDPLEFDRYTEFHQNTRALSETASDTFAINTSLDAIRSGMDSLFDRQKRSIKFIQDALLRIRMVEFGTIKTRLQRAARVTAGELGREVDLSLINGEGKVDTQMLDLLSDPLMHLIRNAVVHGIEPPEIRRLLGKSETGRIVISFANEITHIILTVSDDGSGISASRLKERAVSAGILEKSSAQDMPDHEALNLIFEPGLSTAEKLSMSAGRGIGMSIVKSGVEAVGGSIEIESKPQSGTRMVISIPLKMSMLKAVVVRTNGQYLAIPSDRVLQIAYKNSQIFTTIDMTTFMSSDKENLPVRDVSTLLFGRSENLATDDQVVVIAGTEDDKVALIVDEVIRTEEVALKTLGRPLDRIKEIIGVAVTGNDEVLPVLNVGEIIAMRHAPERIDAVPQPETRCQTILIVDDSPSVRHMTSKIVEGAGWRPVTARDGIEALELIASMGEPPTMILTDIEMPRMDGFELIRSLNSDQTLSSIPVVVITSRSGEKHRGIAEELGIEKFLSKPFNDSELLETIRSFS